MLQLCTRHGQPLHRSPLATRGPLPASPGTCQQWQHEATLPSGCLHAGQQLGVPAQKLSVGPLCTSATLAARDISSASLLLQGPGMPWFPSLVEGWTRCPTQLGQMFYEHQLATSSEEMLYASPRFLTSLERLWIGPYCTLLLTRLWDQDLGAYLFFSVFISLLCVDPITQALPS